MKPFYLKTISYFTITLLISLSCNNQNKIIGKWKRYGDSRSGSLIKIEKFGELYQGSILYIVDSDEMYGWQVGDICWKNIKYIEHFKYTATSVSKGFQNSKPIIKYDDIILLIKNDNTLIVKNFVSDKTLKGGGKVRQYKRIQ